MRLFPSLFDQLDTNDRRAFAFIAGAAGIGGIALAAYFAATGSGLAGVVILAAVGLWALVIARRLLTNRSAGPGGELVSPWLTLGIGVVFVAVGVASILQGDYSASWTIVPGVAALVFAWQRLRRRPRSPQGA